MSAGQASSGPPCPVCDRPTGDIGAAVGVALVPSAVVVVADRPHSVWSSSSSQPPPSPSPARWRIGRRRSCSAPPPCSSSRWGVSPPYAPLLPRWVSLGGVGLLLLVLGGTYERRRQQAREAVAWVTRMR